MSVALGRAQWLRIRFVVHDVKRQVGPGGCLGVVRLILEFDS